MYDTTTAFVIRIVNAGTARDVIRHLIHLITDGLAEVISEILVAGVLHS